MWDSEFDSHSSSSDDSDVNEIDKFESFNDIKKILKENIFYYKSSYFEPEFFVELIRRFFPDSDSQYDISKYVYFKNLLENIYAYKSANIDKYDVDFLLEFLRNNNFKTLFDNGFEVSIFNYCSVNYTSYISDKDPKHICKSNKEEIQVEILDFLKNDTNFDFQENYKKFMKSYTWKVLHDITLKYAIDNNYKDKVSINECFKKLLRMNYTMEIPNMFSYIFDFVLNYTKIEDDFKPTIIMNSELFSAPYKIMYFFKRTCFVFKQNKFTSDCIKYLLDNFLTSDLDKNYIKHTIIPEIESKTEVEMDKGSKSNLLQLLKST